MSQSSFDFGQLDEELASYDAEKENDIGRREYLDIAQEHPKLWSEYENNFMRDTYARYEFTPKQRILIDQMAMKHPEIH